MSKEFNIGLLMGFLTGVIIFILILLFQKPLPSLQAKECKARFVSWCYDCLSRGWPARIEESPILPIEINICMKKYFGVIFPKTTDCKYAQKVCEEFGVS